MLIIEQYGIRLSRVQKQDIEMIRKWRNQKCVSDYMEYKKRISRWAQWRWFKRINNKLNYYFIIESEGKKVGVINVKNYNPDLGFAEGGIFIGDPDFIDTLVPVYSTLCLLNFTFLKIGFKKSVVRILKTNQRAIQYNKMIGYVLKDGQENYENQLYELSKENYIKKSDKLNKAAVRLNPDTAKLKYIGGVSDLQIEEVNKLFRN